MKYIAFLLMILLAGNVYAGTTFTKISDTILKKSDTKQIIIAEDVTLLTLRTRKANLEKSKADYNISIDAQIAELDKDIAEAVKLGIREIDINGNIVP